MPKRKRGGITGDADRRRRRDAQRRRREDETEEGGIARREADAEHHRNVRIDETWEDGIARREADAEHHRNVRIHETEEDAVIRRAENVDRNQELRSQETDEEAILRRAEDAERHRESRSQETEEEAIVRRAQDAERHRESRSQETEEEAIVRRAQDAERHRNATQQEIIEVVPEEEPQRNNRVRPSRNGLHNVARSAVTSDVQQHTCGQFDNSCGHCGALFFSGERNTRGSYPKCCHNGKFVEQERAFPDELRRLFVADHNLSAEFLNNIRSYNSAFSFASMGAQVDAGSNRNCFRIHGAIYHKTSPLRPDRPGQEKYAQIYILDADQALRQRQNMTRNVALDPQLLTSLDSIIRNSNPYAQAFKMLKEFEESELQQGSEATDVKMFITGEASSGHHRGRYNIPTHNEVAIVFKSEDGVPPSDRDIVIHPRGGGLVNIYSLNPNLEPMTYVLFFPHGDRGFQVQRQYTELQFYSHRVSVRQNIFNAILYGRKLFQQYLVDSYVKVEGSRLGYIRKNQQKLRVETYMGLADHVYRVAERAGVRPGIPVILPSTHMGSPRCMQQNYQDAMAIVRDFGKPDLFLTFTCNPKWPEITENLFPGQKAHDRPDIVARVFNVKKKDLLEDLLKKHVLGVCVADIHVIEFQKRGLPHMHLLLILAEQDKLQDSDSIDSLVSAELPDPEVDLQLSTIVRSSMIHGPCGALNPNSPCMVDGKCSKGYPKSFQEETVHDVGGYPLYRRREDGNFVMIRDKIIDNRWVVPHNPFLTKKYNSHINLEVCSSIKSVKYLFKYVYKGHDAANVVLEQSGAETLRWDEVKNYLNARYVSAPEAIWRLFEMKMHAKSHTVIRLPVHLENLQPVYFSDDKEREALQRASERNTMLTGWFQLNIASPEANNFLYSEIPHHFTWGRDYAWHTRRSGEARIIPRMYSVSPKDVERFYLRMLLCHVKGAKSFSDLKTYENVLHATYKETCRARGLLQDDEEWRNCMNEAQAFQMPPQLRQMFAFICIFGSCTEPLAIWEDFKEPLSEDFARSYSREESFSLALKSIEFHLKPHNISLASIGLPQPSTTAEIGANASIYDAATEMQLAEEMKENLNAEQRVAYEAILDSVRDSVVDSVKTFCVNAFAGSGKTYLFKAILHAVRGMNHVAVPVAFTGIAAVLLAGGKTAHSTFKLPIPISEDSTCRIRQDSTEAEEFRAAKLFIWDECTMTPHHALEAVDRLLRELTGLDIPFGGKTFVLGGDWRQILPVVRHGNRASAIESCLKNSYLWPHFQQLTLIQNMRLQPNEREFSEWLLKLGDGRLKNENDLHEDTVEVPSACVVERSIVEEIFGPSDHFDSQDLAGKAILCPKNDETLKLNEEILSRFPGRNFTFYSADSISTEDPEEQEAYQMDFVNSLTPSGMPPHRLNLKEGVVIMLLRNINASIGLCNGTRLIVKKIMRNFLDCEVLTGQNAGNRIFLTRADLTPSDTNLPFQLTRRQFPVRLAFAMTINKSQGQTLNKVGLFLPRPVFSHGMLYVAFSRATSVDNIRVSVSDTSKQGKLIPGCDKVFTQNVVYREILQ